MFQSDVCNQDSPDCTRQRLLEAAGEVFADKGFRDATVREICTRAGANIASINYYFGGKDRLYAEVLRYVDSQATQRHPPSPPSTIADVPEARLSWFVVHFVARIFDSDRPSWHERLMTREFIEPTFALDELADRAIRDRARIIQNIVREILGPGATDQDVQRGAASVVGQCLFYWHARHILPHIMPALSLDAANMEPTAGHIFLFSVYGLHAQRDEIARRAGKPPPGKAEAKP